MTGQNWHRVKHDIILETKPVSTYMQQLLKRKLNQPTKVIECIKGQPTIEEYYDLYFEAEKYNSQISEAVLLSPNAQSSLNTGRVVVIKSESAQDHLLAVIVKTPPTNSKLYIVFVIRPDMPFPVENASGGGKSQDKSSTFDQGFFVMPKSRRGLLDEYTTSVSARKGRGVVNIKLPHQGSACGMSYEVREVDIKEFLCICSSKIKVDQVGLLEDVSSSVYAKTVQLLQDLKSDGEIVQTSNPYAPVLPATASGRDSTSPQVEPFQYPKKHEGHLSAKRQWAVRNSTLNKLGINRKLQGYISLDTNFLSKDS